MQVYNSYRSHYFVLCLALLKLAPSCVDAFAFSKMIPTKYIIRSCSPVLRQDENRIHRIDSRFRLAIRSHSLTSISSSFSRPIPDGDVDDDEVLFCMAVGLNAAKDACVNEERANLQGLLMSAKLHEAAPSLEIFVGKDDVTMNKNGVVRFNHAISTEEASDVLKFVLDEWEVAKADIAEGMDAKQRFSSMLSSRNRWDLKIPISSLIIETLQKLLRKGSPVGDLLETLITSEAELFELGTFVNLHGAGRQVIHSDTMWTKNPVLYTCTIALQDVSEDMGPTVFIPGSQTNAAHKKFDSTTPFDGDRCKEEYLRKAPFVLSTLSCGDAAIYDSRTLHCGGANRSNKRRVLMYFSFCNPETPKDAFWNVASIRPEYVGKYKLKDFRYAKDAPVLPSSA